MFYKTKRGNRSGPSPLLTWIRNGIYLDLEVPNQEISAGLRADLRSVARQCELLIFITLKWGRGWGEGGEREIHPFHQAWHSGRRRTGCRLHLAARRGTSCDFELSIFYCAVLSHLQILWIPKPWSKQGESELPSPLRNKSHALTASKLQELKDIHVRIAAVANLGFFAFEI